MSDFVSIRPKDEQYIVMNHNGATMGCLEYSEAHQTHWFRARRDWGTYSAAQLEEIAKIIRDLDKRTWG